MGVRHRVRLRWSPQWEGSIKSWASKFIIENQWHCDRIHEFDDLLQDAHLIYLKIAERYPRVVEPKHFMALFQVALRNKIHDHSRYMRRKRLLHEETSVDAAEIIASQVGETTNHGYLRALIAEAPEELRLALILLETQPETLRTQVPGLRENLNMRLRRILGVEGKFDFAGLLRSMLTP